MNAVGIDVCIFAVGFVPFLWFCVFWMGQSNPKVMFLQDIKNRDPVLADRFHADVSTVIFSKPITQLIQAFSKGRKAGLLIFSTTIGIRDADAGKDPSFVDIKSAAVFSNDFKRQ